MKVTDAQKSLKEDFVSGLTGSSHINVFLLCIYLPISFFFHHALCIFIEMKLPRIHNYIRNNYKRWYSPAFSIKLIFDFCFTIVPHIGIYIYSETCALEICIFTELFALAILFYLQFSQGNCICFPNNNKRKCYFVKAIQKPHVKEESSQNDSPTKQEKPKNKLFFFYFYGNCNSMLVIGKAFLLTIIATCISILFVDFKLYPRSLGKTEIRGVSLMDVGTGALLFANGVSSRQVRRELSFLKRIIYTLSQCSIIIFVGFLRAFLIKAFNYQEHVSEYGVHWNFFITIAAVALICTFLPNCLRSNAHYIGIVMMIGTTNAYKILLGYDIALRYGLSDYILSAPRDTFVSKNREGIFQCFSYSFCYLCGIGLGRIYLEDKIQNKYSDMKFLFSQLKFCLLLLIVNVLSYFYLNETSRRLGNLSYGAFCVLVTGTCFVLAYLHDRITLHQHSNLIFEGMSLSRLLYFLLGNVFVGLVNLSTDTLNSSDWEAFWIINGYMMVLTIPFAVGFVTHLKVKYW